jgi:hypothetical protein
MQAIFFDDNYFRSDYQKNIKLNWIFLAFQEELDLSAPNKTAMLSLPKEKKWQIYCSQKGSLGSDTGLSNDPEFYIEQVTTLAHLGSPQMTLKKLK